MNALNQLDLAFVVDTTSSMGPFIDAARRRMSATLPALTATAAEPIDLWVGLVEYRDHVPQDNTFAARVHAFADLERVRKTISRLEPYGGGDLPEAVYDGLHTAAEGLAWRAHSRRLAVLIGDAPPHGCSRGGDGFPNGCPCGLTTDLVTALFEQKGITLYAVGMTRAVTDSFSRLARYTGGEYFEEANGDATIRALEALLAREFGDLAFDRQVLAQTTSGAAWTVDGLGTALACPRAKLSTSLSRLGRRGLLP